ncbi:hypothetical protein Tco_0793750 [Tanacetum coccineum]
MKTLEVITSIRRIHFHRIRRIQLSVQYSVFIQQRIRRIDRLEQNQNLNFSTYLSELIDEESYGRQGKESNKDEIAEIFKIETDVFDYETPLCLAFNEFNYLLKVDPDLLTKDIMGFKTYEDYKNDRIYEWNENVSWVYDKPWLDNGIWKEPKPVKHTCKPFNYKTGCSKWPTYSWREDGYCNGGNFPSAYHIGNSLHYQDLEWYEALEDSKLKWKNHEINYHDYNEEEYENETHNEGHELCGIKTREVPVCQIKRYKLIKYSFNDEEEYGAVKEDEYDDLTITSNEACRAYQEIFRMIDEGWKDLGSKEISTNISGEFTNMEILKCRSLRTSRLTVQHNLANKLNMENLPSKNQRSFSF